MNIDTWEGRWKQLSGKVRREWGELTDDDLQQAKGSRDILLGKLQERYGLAHDKASKRLRELEEQ